jgi:hypothetical protein
MPWVALSPGLDSAPTKRMSSLVSKKFRVRSLLLSTLLLAADNAFAQPFYCTPIRPGETAPHVAKRITGEANGARESWFQIVDPATSRFVAKARYGSVRAGWPACVATALQLSMAAPADRHAPTWSRHLRSAYDDIVRLIQSPNSDLGLWLVLLALITIATHSADHYFRDRQQVVAAMQRFSQKFVREFERPLAAADVSARPIQSRLRFAPHASRLDILIAPGAGRRYPNLTDHRNNVEYDLRRVLAVLRDEPFVTGRPYMDGRWVVVPFSLKPAITQAGGR